MESEADTYNSNLVMSRKEFTEADVEDLKNQITALEEQVSKFKRKQQENGKRSSL